MLQIQGKQNKNQGNWNNLNTANQEYMAIQLADSIKSQGQYQIVRVVDSNGAMVYQA